MLKEEIEELQEAAASFNNGVGDEIKVLWKLVRKDRVEDFAEEDIFWIRENAIAIAKEAIQVAAMCDKWGDLIYGTEEENTEEITMAVVNEREFKKYVALQDGGETNMFDIAYVVKETGLSEEKIAYIMQHYAALEEVYGVVEPLKVYSAFGATKEALKAANAFMAEKNMELGDGDELIVVFDNATLKVTIAGEELKLNLNLVEAIHVPIVVDPASGDSDE